MNQVSINLKNCYGINKLSHNISFKKRNGCVIYASNGTMKTSFAKTFLDISKGTLPTDKIYNKQTTCSIKILDNNADSMRYINDQDIFVIESYKEQFDFKNISRLLVNKDLKRKHDRIYNEIRIEKEGFIKKIVKASKLKQSEIENTIINDFSEIDGTFLDILLSLEDDLIINENIDVETVKYGIIFDKSVLDFIKNEDVMDSIEKYSEKYMELIENSDIFEKNLFTHNQAANVNKELEKNNFFKAKHEIKFKNNKIITKKSELENLIQEEKEKILSDNELKGYFNLIDTNLEKNKILRDFKLVIGNCPLIIPKLGNISAFKKEIWISILNYEKESYDRLINLYKSGKEDIESIVFEAKQEESTWKKVIDSI